MERLVLLLIGPSQANCVTGENYCGSVMKLAGRTEDQSHSHKGLGVIEDRHQLHSLQ